MTSTNSYNIPLVYSTYFQLHNQLRFIKHNFDPGWLARNNLDPFERVEVNRHNLRHLFQGRSHSIQADNLPDQCFLYPLTPGVQAFIDDQYLFTAKVLDRLAQGTAFLLLLDPCEANVIEGDDRGNSLSRVTEFLCNKHINPNSLIFINNCYNLAEIQDQLNAQGQQIRALYFPFLRSKIESLDKRGTPWNFEYRKGIIPQRTFLNTNYIWKPHRIFFLAEIVKRNLIDNFYISFKHEPPQVQYMLDDQARTNLSWAVGNSYILWEPWNSRDRIHISPELIGHIEQQILPLELDTFDPARRGGEASDQLVRLFDQSLISLISETHFEQEEIHITEKTFRAISLEHPFIIMASKGHLAALREQGFQTFSQFWDESYDSVLDPITRFELVLGLVEQIASWSPGRKEEFRQAVQPILKYNRQLLDNLDTRSNWTADHERVWQYITNLTHKDFQVD